MTEERFRDKVRGRGALRLLETVNAILGDKSTLALGYLAAAAIWEAGSGVIWAVWVESK